MLKMFSFFVRHEARDYKVWKKGYNECAMKQKQGSVYYQHVYQTIDNPNQVTVIHDFHSLEKAIAFFTSEDLKSTMKKLVRLVSLKFGLCVLTKPLSDKVEAESQVLYRLNES